ncbi:MULTISPECIES: DUF5924 family protein [Pseudomonas]|uniref:DUF2914 domain-containing protein n=1 Tax=Pseudomonas luteola TaxID=47886 RepID=A0A2X2D2Q4_PSELU|nr:MULTISPECIES: DUF5924 family protein [Pseudomonas]MBF8642200.1 DUF2914 domain-containing protein [Pseudomonas zeshuii]RRW43503.1 DUF2914 domain-containing protein [Pseudomonas luteola]SHJ07173.1 Protein of unknown function [Pseudomonas zeshuii]SPZ13243.1 membrane protein [Pseudomonas luteola]
MPTWKRYVSRLVDLATVLINRYPRLIALAGFVSGVCSFLLVDRQHGFAKVMAIVMLASWLWLMVENVLRQWVTRRFGWNLPPGLFRYATQMIHQESLFFVLPFLFVTTTWNSGQAIFTGLLAAMAVVSIVDPLYYKALSSRRWIFLGYHTLTLFAVLLTSLPIILQLTTTQSYRLALGVAVLLSFPSILVALSIRRLWQWPVVLGLSLMVGGLGWVLRTWVPPATLWLTDVAVTSSFDNLKREPGKSLKKISAVQLRSQGLYAYTAINAPRGLSERIYHVWLHNGDEVDRIPLEISGGREAGYRAWTHKQNFPSDVAGRWQVQIITEDGQMIGTLRFEVTP